MKKRSKFIFHLPPPNYSRWLFSGVMLVGLVILSFVLGAMAAAQKGAKHDLFQVFLVSTGLISLLCLWFLAFLLRVFFNRLDRRSGKRYVDKAQQAENAWWAYSRQTVALVEAVLVAGVCRTPQQRAQLFNPDYQPAIPKKADWGIGMALRSAEVTGECLDEREEQLARLLAMQWREQQTWATALQPVKCYWHGSSTAWDAFVEQMAKSWPRVQLPKRPEPWEGVDSLDAIIDQLQGMPAGTRILCAGCQSSPVQPDSRLPAGEAAVLWLLGPQGGVRLSRGECCDPDYLVESAEQVLEKSELVAAPPLCVSFSHPDVPELAALGWNTKHSLQDANFGALPDLEAMVVLTLAASYVTEHGVPCAWMANDPLYPLVLGVVKPSDSSTETPKPDTPVTS